MRKKVASALLSFVLGLSLLTGGLPVRAFAGEESTEAGIEVPTASGSIRPEYRALDYVQIEDEQYKELKVSIFPPLDDSEEAQTAYRTALDTTIMTQLFNLYPVKTYPRDLLSYVTGSLKATYIQYADLYGMDLPTFLKTYMEMDEETFDREVVKAAKQTLTEEILLRALAEKENITLSEEEYQKGLGDYLVKYSYDSPEDLLDDFDEPTVRISLLMDKVLDYLEDCCEITEEAGTEADSLPADAG